MVASLTWSNSTVELEPGYAIEGAIQSTSGLAFFGLGLSLLLFGLKFRKAKAEKTHVEG